jgi:hypothetical protein
MYTASNWLQPQIYADPNQSAIVTPPNGWGLQLVPKPKPRGMGVFDSWDPTTWGLAEWVILGIGVYFIWNVGKGGSSGSGRKRKGRGSKYGPYYEKLSASDKAKAREAMGD